MSLFSQKRKRRRPRNVGIVEHARRLSVSPSYLSQLLSGSYVGPKGRALLARYHALTSAPAARVASVRLIAPAGTVFGFSALREALAFHELCGAGAERLDTRVVASRELHFEFQGAVDTRRPSLPQVRVLLDHSQPTKNANHDQTTED